MKNINLRNFIYALIGLSALIWFILGYISGLNLSSAKDFFGLIPKVVTIDLLIITLFLKWGWKLRVFKGWLVPFPNLSGTWLGEIHSNWVNPETGETPLPIPVMLTIRQNFSDISCLMQTKEMRSYSTAEGFIIDEDRQVKQLSYLYTCKPRNKFSNRSLPHDGAHIFNIIEAGKKLDGKYWKDRRTYGEIQLTFFSDKLLEELPEGFDKHPVSDSQKNIS